AGPHDRRSNVRRSAPGGAAEPTSFQPTEAILDMKRLTFATMALAVLGLFVVQQSPGSTATGYRMSPALRYALAVESGQQPRLLPNGQPVPIPSGAVLAARDPGLSIT